MRKIVALAQKKKKKTKSSPKSSKQKSGLRQSPKQRRKSTFQKLKEGEELIQRQKDELNKTEETQAVEEVAETVEVIPIDDKIHSICHSGTIEELNETFSGGATYAPNYVKQSWNRTTALHMAAYRADNEMLKVLLRRGWSANFKDGRGETAMHWVCKHNGRDDLKDTRAMRKALITRLNKLKTGYKKLQSQQKWMLASIASQKEKKIKFAEERARKKQNTSWKYRTERALQELEMSSKFYVKPAAPSKKKRNKKKQPYSIKDTNSLLKKKNSNGLLDGEIEVDINVDEEINSIDVASYVLSNTSNTVADGTDTKKADPNEKSNDGEEKQSEESTADEPLAESGNEPKRSGSKKSKKIIAEMVARILDKTHVEVAKRKLLAVFEDKKKIKVEEALKDLRKQVEADLMKQIKDQQDVFKARAMEFRRNIKDARNQVKHAQETSINYLLLSVRALLDNGANLHEPG